VTTDDKGIAIIRTRGEHDHEGNEQKKKICVRVRKRSEDVTSRPSKIIRQDLQVHGGLTLQPTDLKNVARGNMCYLANGRGTM
jgi:hypothetical protein